MSNYDKIYTMFISYRSPSLEDKEKYNCKTLRGEQCTEDNCIRCSYRECSFRRAVIFAKRQSYRYIIVPPLRMLAPDALLSVSDFVEYCTELEDYIASANLFIRFEIVNDSYWTLMESKLWSMKNNRLNGGNDAYTISLNSDGETQSKPFPILPMSSTERKYYWKILNYSRPNNRHNFAWGKYSDCFLSRCPNCGRITVMSRRALKTIGEYNLSLRCVYCGKGEFRYSYKWGPRQPAKINYSGISNSQMKAINPNDMIKLLLDNSRRAPAQYALICSENELFVEGIAIAKLFNMAYNTVACSKSIELRFYMNEVLHKQVIWTAPR